MQLIDFANGLAPGLVTGYAADKSTQSQVMRWVKLGLLVCYGTKNPDPVLDKFDLTDKGRIAATGIDPSRWPYICGVAARIAGKSKDSHGLVGGCMIHWIAGWERLGND